MPLIAAAPAPVLDRGQQALTLQLFNPIVENAIGRWTGSLTDPQTAEALSNVTFTIRDLPNSRLGMAFAGGVAINVDAAEPELCSGLQRSRVCVFGIVRESSECHWTSAIPLTQIGQLFLERSSPNCKPPSDIG